MTTALTLETVEQIVGYTAANAVAEYKDGEYGEPEDWNAEKAAAAEIDGDAGEQIRRKFKDEDTRVEAYMLWQNAVEEAWGDDA
jgi:hypothetical protein